MAAKPTGPKVKIHGRATLGCELLLRTGGGHAKPDGKNPNGDSCRARLHAAEIQAEIISGSKSLRENWRNENREILCALALGRQRPKLTGGTGAREQ
jgi:ribulose 1,5-bisphosphate carboxylase large subunit-like protein